MSVTSADREKCHDCQEIKASLDTLLAEVRQLRRERLPADPEQIEQLLSALFVIFADAEFTAAWVLETCIENDADAARLKNLTMGAIGHVPTSNMLSRFLSKATGTFGNYKLEVVNPRSRVGVMFAVYPVTM